MNDEFLQRLRSRPPAAFAARLKARLDAQPHRNTPRSWRYTRYLAAAALLGGVAIAIVVPDLLRRAAPATAIVPPVQRPLVRDEIDTRVVRAQPPLASGQAAPAVTVDYGVSPATARVAATAPRPSIRTDCFGAACEFARQLDLDLARTNGPTLAIETRRVTNGFARLCARGIDVLFVPRPIEKSEMVNCTSYGTTYYELPVAYEALVIVVSRSNLWANMLSLERLKTVWAKNAHWSDLNPAWPNIHIGTIGFGPGSDRDAEFFREVVLDEPWLYASASVTRSSDSFLATLRMRDSLGVVNYGYYLKQVAAVRALAIEVAGRPVTVRPPTIHDGSYPLARPLFLYVNAQEAAQRPEVMQLAVAAVDAPSGVIEAASLVAPSERMRRVDRDILELHEEGTVFNGEYSRGMNVERALTDSERKSYF